MPTIHVTDNTFKAEVLDSDLPVLVDFWATWCSPCRQVAPILEEISDEYAGRITIAKVDADANPGVVGAYGITHLPTLNIFVNGEVTKSIVGGRPKRALQNEINEVLAEVGEPTP